jgi:hypothetical protein
MSRTEMPLPSMRRAADNGPSPASSNKIPEGVRTTVQLPPDPLASTQISMDIPTIRGQKIPITLNQWVLRITRCGTQNHGPGTVS